MTDAPRAYPLQWPPGWPRTEAAKRQRWPNPVGLSVALKELESELRLLGVKQVVLSSNCALGMETAADSGVVAFGVFDEQQIAIPCDRWTTVAANVRAIAKTVNALRGLDRWGAQHMIRAMFQGFRLLGSPSKSWRDILGIGPHDRVTREHVEARRRTLASMHHPDVTGRNDGIMAEINAAADQAVRELGA